MYWLAAVPSTEGSCWEAAGREDKYAEFLREVCRRTGRLIAFWQNVGFVHGVLNTDNMSILGETIDYGYTSPLSLPERYPVKLQPPACFWVCFLILPPSFLPYVFFHYSKTFLPPLLLFELP